MRERIILAPGCSGTDLIRSLAKYGVNSFGLRVESALGLAQNMLMRSGISEKRDFISRNEEPALINSFVKGIGYFSAASYTDTEKISAALYKLRMLVVDADEDKRICDELIKGEFKEKNEAIIEVLKEYKDNLKKRKLIDTIGIIRNAIENAESIDADFVILEEFPLMPLEEKLLEKASGGNYKSTNLAQLFIRDDTEPKDFHITEAYGESNEIEAVLGYILKNHIPFDQCTIAVADPSTYGQLFCDYMSQYGIPISFGFGIPVLNSTAGRLLKELYLWNEKGYNGINALERIVNSQSIDHSKFVINKRNDVIKMAGQLRISFDKEENDKRISEFEASLVPGNKDDDKKLETLIEVKKLAEYLEKGYSGFIREFTYTRFYGAGLLDKAARGALSDAMDTVEKYSNADELKRVIPKLLGASVCPEVSEPGAIYVTSIEGALSSPRPYLFIMGMSSANFPGSPKENYLLLDSDLCLFCKPDKAPTSTKVVRDRIEQLKDLLKVAQSLGAEVRISYSDYNLAELKDANASSVLLDIYNDIHPGATLEDFKKTFEKKGFFDETLSRVARIGRAVKEGVDVEPDYDEPMAAMPKADLERAYAPTEIETFFSCPRRFYIKSVCGIREPEDDNPFKVINPNQLGDLVHKLMEELANSGMAKTAFLEMAEKSFDKFLKERPPMHPSAADKERKDFLKIMELAHDRDPKNKVLIAEDELKAEHPCGLKLHGYPDRIEKMETENIIVDYKVKSKVDHADNDIETCLQVVIYAWLAENDNLHIPIERCEYRYLKQGIEVNCDYDVLIKGRLDSILQKFYDALVANDFPCTTEEENCRYCKFADICDRKIEIL